MKRVRNLIRIGGNVWWAELETVDGRPFVTTIQAACQAEAWAKALQTEPDAA